MSSLLDKILKDFIPKIDIQQEEFLQKYPKFDGRGLLIAIIDTGVDVSYDGLQKTSTGLPKIFDCFDFSGTGVVDTSMVKKTEENNSLLLLSGKKIKLPQKWKNPSNDWHLGIKSMKKMSPNTLNENDNKRGKTEEENCFENEIKVVTSKETIEKLNFVREMHNKNDNIDCIVWNDGKKWCTCIVAASTRNLENAKILTNFRDEHEYCYIFENVCCCVTIKNDGNVLELFIPYNDHGSCVAQVAAAHYPDKPEKDGLALGAQIVSMNVFNEEQRIRKDLNDIVKALNKCIELGVDIVNLSIGTGSSENSAIINLVKRMVNEHGIVITQAPGNYGPFISSMRTDTNNIDDEMFTIGALLTPEMKPFFGKENDNSPARLCYYSSKGPLQNGARGVTLVAPGVAIVEHPKWHPLKKQIFGGTSCASPIAAGAIACLLSGLKANSIKYSPAMLKMVLSNTAFLPEGGDKLGYGNGIIQINSAFEYFKTFKMELLQKILLPKLFTKKSKRKGIVFYKLSENMFNYCIEIESDEEKEIPWILKLTPEEHHSHIEYSKTIANNSFNVKIDAKKLKRGSLYYSEIHGFDPSNLSMGPLFYFPITVIVPEKATNNFIGRKIFVTPPSMFNLFIDPDKSCNKCIVKIHDSEDAKIVQFQKTINKLDYGNVYDTDFESKKDITFRPSEASCLWKIKIRWEKVFEIYIYKALVTETDCVLNSCLKIYFEEG